jgi:hypothetical protein
MQDERSAKLTADVTSLNKSFARCVWFILLPPVLPRLHQRLACSWVESQSQEKLAYFWVQGCEEYLAHAKSIKEEYADVFASKKQHHAPSGGSGLRSHISDAVGTWSSPPVRATETTKPSPAPSAAAEQAPTAAPSTFGSFAAPAASAPAPTFTFGGGGAQSSGSTTPQLFGVNASTGAAKDPAPSFSAGPSTFGGGFSFGSAPGSFGAVTTSAAPAGQAPTRCTQPWRCTAGQGPTHTEGVADIGGGAASMRATGGQRPGSWMVHATRQQPR